MPACRSRIAVVCRRHARSDRFRASRRRVEVAQKMVVSLVDDLDGSGATETVEFALDGKTYEIDLSSTNAGKLRDTLARYTTAARKSARTPRSIQDLVSGAPRLAVRRRQPHPIREWAHAQGMQLADRGRIPDAVINAYHDRIYQAPLDIPHQRATRSKATF
jgi:hypothetical protein